ncbi:MAG: (2Fe-2S)-binding protein [Cyanobacteria bacterium SZAS LIN-2]|nr:(2Fe-2S)-binding protein [Cyanobacteria bacterium SZAS LIN-3]MBS1995998.1 (2Fe-2S)-binding protein [Cyanobacteria bacterium SZAS LIN-2]MBS2011184.1 (2Fe-2S)-binding protein [Cyanobacteria bacterium SZAS TMP-1]
MYMCSCHAVVQSQIVRAIAEGTTTWKQLTRKLKISTQCGICAKSAKQYFEEELAKFQAQAK